MIRLKKGILFQSDPAFKGKKRELTVNDFVYSFKRLMDPKLRSPWQFILEKKIVGLDELAEQAKKSGAFNYDAKVAGLEVLDNYTLRIRLNDTDYNFGYFLAMPATAAQAHEVVEAYEDSNAHPVGTGPYVLKKWVRGSKIILEANPEYRDVVWDFQPGSDPYDKKLVAEMKGKKIPQIGVIDISIMEESQSRWLAFQDAQLDYLNIPQEYTPKALVGDKLAPDLLKQGFRLQRVIDPDLTYTAFNFKDPLVGGFSKEKTALRRAIVMSFDTEEEIKVVRRGQAVAARRRSRRASSVTTRSTNPRSSSTRCWRAGCSINSDTRRGRTECGRCPTASRCSSRCRRRPTRSTGTSTNCGKSRWTGSASGSSFSRRSSRTTTGRRKRAS